MDGVTRVPPPFNEPVRQYPPGSADRSSLTAKLGELAGQRHELTMTIGGKAGSVFNLVRWMSARSIKETFLPPTSYCYPHMS